MSRLSALPRLFVSNSGAREMSALIEPLDLQDDVTLQRVWQMQQISYLIEAQWMQFEDIPPFLETMEELRQSSEQFYGWYTLERELAGVVAIEYNTPYELHICRLMVRRDHFRQGIGRALMEYILDTPGIKRFTICTGVRNEPAMKLYSSLGFHKLFDEEIVPGIYLRTLEKKNEVHDMHTSFI